MGIWRSVGARLAFGWRPFRLEPRSGERVGSTAGNPRCSQRRRIPASGLYRRPAPYHLRAIFTGQPRSTAVDSGKHENGSDRIFVVDLGGRLSNPTSVLARALKQPTRSPNRPGRHEVQLQHRLDEHEVDELATAYCDGATIEQLAAQFCIHRTTVMSHLDRREMPRRRIRPSGRPSAAAAKHISG